MPARALPNMVTMARVFLYFLIARLMVGNWKHFYQAAPDQNVPNGQVTGCRN